MRGVASKKLLETLSKQNDNVDENGILKTKVNALRESWGDVDHINVKETLCVSTGQHLK